MPALDYGKGAYKRSRGNLPELPVVNMFVEQSGADGIVMQSHKALLEVAEVGPGPVRAKLEKDGVFGGDRFVISGSGLYRNDTLIGSAIETKSPFQLNEWTFADVTDPKLGGELLAFAAIPRCASGPKDNAPARQS